MGQSMVTATATLGGVRKLFSSNLARQLAGLALLCLAVALLAWRVDLPEALAALDDVKVGWALAGVGVFGLSKVIHAARWQVTMRPFANPRFAETAKLFFLGNLVNGLLPFRAGDVVRVQIGARRLGVPRPQMVSSVFVVETLLDGVAFAGLLCCALALGSVPGLTRGIFLSLAAASILACVVAALLSVRADQVGGWLERQPLPGAAKTGDVVRGLLDGLRPFSDLARLLPALTLSVAGWIAEAGAYAAVGKAFGLELNALDYVVVMVAANLLTAVPLTPLGLGIYELGLQELVAVLGPTPELALAYVLGAHILFSFWILVAGVASAYWLPLRADELLYLRGGREPSGLSSAASAAGRTGQTQ